MSFTRLPSEHHDFIHDIAYDWYGQRLATCSSDQKIKVWDRNPSSKQWECTAEIKAHSGSVNKLSWAHPEFGQILASCSADRVIHIYEEQIDGKSGARSWKKQGRLVDSRDAVVDLQFSPRHHGLKLATASLDGRVRIYESTDVMNLSVWPLVEEFEAAKANIFCLCWNPSPFDVPQLVIGAENIVKLWEFQAKSNRWVQVSALEGHNENVHDVAWAPNVGRSFHLIATACKDQMVRIFQLKFNKSTSTYQVDCVAKLNAHKAEVWRVSWNVTGTILASTGDDGITRLWKADFNGVWHAVMVTGNVSNNQNGDKGGNSTSLVSQSQGSTGGFSFSSVNGTNKEGINNTTISGFSSFGSGW
jgi:nucleoporin SEH1